MGWPEDIPSLKQFMFAFSEADLANADQIVEQIAKMLIEQEDLLLLLLRALLC